MADQPSRSSRGTSRTLWILVLVLLTPAVVVPLLVPLYDQVDPTLFGFPFFFWVQFAMIVGAAVLTLTAFVISTRADARDRAERRARRAGR
jgi:undecaprenyl pyrophosphate phosphatase UppP